MGKRVRDAVAPAHLGSGTGTKAIFFAAIQENGKERVLTVIHAHTQMEQERDIFTDLRRGN